MTEETVETAGDPEDVIKPRPGGPVESLSQTLVLDEEEPIHRPSPSKGTPQPTFHYLLLAIVALLTFILLPLPYFLLASLVLITFDHIYVLFLMNHSFIDISSFPYPPQHTFQLLSILYFSFSSYSASSTQQS